MPDPGIPWLYLPSALIEIPLRISPRIGHTAESGGIWCRELVMQDSQYEKSTKEIGNRGMTPSRQKGVKEVAVAGNPDGS